MQKNEIRSASITLNKNYIHVKPQTLKPKTKKKMVSILQDLGVGQTSLYRNPFTQELTGGRGS